MIGHLNINSIRHKFVELTELCKENLDVLLISESKIDDTFTTNQFRIEGFHAPFRYDRNKNGGGVMLYVKESIICKELDHDPLPSDIESMSVEINLRNSKWFLMGVYRPPGQDATYFMENVSKYLSNHRYENQIILGDFNLDTNSTEVEILRVDHCMENVVTEPTCFKSVESPTLIDHIWVTDKKRFKNTTNIETGLSDWHKMTVTMLNCVIPKKEPRMIKYRDFRKLDNEKFEKDLKQGLTELTGNNFDEFDNMIHGILNKHIPIKRKLVRNNSSPFMNKTLRKEIMMRSRKRNLYYKDPTAENWNSFRIQRNKCTRLVRDAKRKYYGSLDLRNLQDNKKFWKLVKPIFSEKSACDKLQALVKDDKIITDKEDLVTEMNDYFANITKSLRINDVPRDDISLETCDEIDRIIMMYENHPSVLKIRSSYSVSTEFSFDHISVSEMEKYVRNLNANKSSPEGDVPVRILKEHIDVLAPKLTKICSSSIENGTFFSQRLKCADVTPLFKKGSKFERTNFRPVSKLPAISKVFERIFFDQISDFMADKLSPILSGFRKRYSTQHALLYMLHNWQREIDQGKRVGVVLMDLSKAFDCINHDLLIAKMHSYGFSKQSLRLIKDYLTDRKQRVGLDGVFSTWLDLLTGVPQGSILGPLLFNIYINDLMLEFISSEVNIGNFADDNTIYASGESDDVIKAKLTSSLKAVASWFSKNGLQLNADKCKLIVFGKSGSNPMSLEFNGETLHETSSVKLLGIVFDNGLTFKDHVTSLAKKVNAKLKALGRITDFMSPEKRKLLANSFVTSQTGYCPLVWGFGSRTAMGKLDRLHDRVSDLIYDQGDEFPKTIHRIQGEILLREIFKTVHGLNPSYMKDIFAIKDSHSYSLRNSESLVKNGIKTVKHGLKTFSYIGSQLWDALPQNVRNSDSLGEFSTEVRDLPTLQCKCRLCAPYVQNVGYI